MVLVILLFACSMMYSIKIEKIKKNNNVFIYKEIVAFTEGKMLDELEKPMEIGKRPYQRFLLAFGSAAIAAVVCLVLGWVLF